MRNSEATEENVLRRPSSKFMQQVNYRVGIQHRSFMRKVPSILHQVDPVDPADDTSYYWTVLAKTEKTQVQQAKDCQGKDR